MSLNLFKQWIMESHKTNPQKFDKIKVAFESIFESTEEVVEDTQNRLSKMSGGLDSIDDILGDINMEPEPEDNPDIDINAILGDSEQSSGDEGFEDDDLEEPIEEGFSD